MNVGNHRNRRERDDTRERVGVLELRNSDANDLTPGARKRGDLSSRRRHVVRLCEGHRLDDDWGSAADRYPADVYLALTSHSAIVPAVMALIAECRRGLRQLPLSALGEEIVA